ncbi:MAG: HEAT repeat domain-containing protein [Planctomycetota bacterium]
MPALAPLLRFLCSTAATCAVALAHGGQYRGPGNVTPPSSGGATSSGGFRGPSDVLPPSTAAGAGATAGSAGGAARVGPSRPAISGAARGYQVGDDLGRWEFWWEFGKDPFLNLRQALYRVDDRDPSAALWNPRLAGARPAVTPPDAADLRAVASQLSSLLSETRDRDTSSACVVALAKIGSARAGFALTPHLLPLLRRGDQELRETAALALGISGDLDDRTLGALTDLLSETDAGKALCGKLHVNVRTRAFAAFGAGLLLRRARRAAVAVRLVRPLIQVVADARDLDRNLVVAAIEALGQFPRGWRGPAASLLRQEVLDALGSYYDREVGAGRQLIQAHVPTAIARVCERDSRRADTWRTRFSEDLGAGLRSRSAAGNPKVNHHIAQSCALALGEMCAPWTDDNSPSHAQGSLLVEVFRDHRDQQTRAFAALALARLGGDRARSFLLRALPRANKALEQPWIAVALGVVAARIRAAGTQDGRDAEVFTLVTDALSRQFRGARNPSTVGAIAVSLGLAGAADVKDTLRQRLIEHRKRDAVAGYVALSLGLLQDHRAIPDLRVLRTQATRRPFVLLQTVRALGLLGDHTLTEQLVAELQGSGRSVARLSATAAALGQIGDRRCLPALRRLAADRDATPLSRAFAAVALGGVCDKDALPWNAAYATQINYRAATETLTDGAAGILDLL